MLCHRYEGITLEYILYCDESTQDGPIFSSFFGGCLVSGKHIDEIVNAIESKKAELHLFGEVKWSKVTENYLAKYIELITLFFSYIKAGKIKVRIMFRNNKDEPSINVVNDSDDKYFRLYYQFIKNAFGFKHLQGEEPVYLRIYLDRLPNKRTKCAEFKTFLKEMPRTSDFYMKSPIRIRNGDIAEITSHDHVLLQCLDIVLGAMFFRLNHYHKRLSGGQKRRGKRTVAKEALYRHIISQINDIFPNFNIGENTGSRGEKYPDFYWSHPYRHWKFKPN